MNKKAYTTPAIREIKVKMSQMVCGSVTGTGDASIGWGGKGTGVEAGSRGGGWDDED